MKPEVHFVTFATADLDAARNFYRAGLGWEPILDVHGDILYFQVAPGLVLGLFDALKFDTDLNRELITSGISGVTLSCNVESDEEVHLTVNKLMTAGGTLVKAAQVGMFGDVFHAYVRDPNGILWEVAHVQGWNIEADGTVQLGDRHGRRRSDPSTRRRRPARSGPPTTPTEIQRTPLVE
jgi:catechol 2,3-dioxygenase-like lactoylglutathione lyase family enzyme